MILTCASFFARRAKNEAPKEGKVPLCRRQNANGVSPIKKLRERRPISIDEITGPTPMKV
jgi:hypothetical protein